MNHLEQAQREEERWDEYENRSWDVKCAKCGTEATATQKALDAFGWHLGRRDNFCPPCDLDHSAGIQIGRARMLMEQMEKDRFMAQCINSDTDPRDVLREPLVLSECPF